MAKLTIEIPYWVDDNDTVNRIYDLFSNVTLSWPIMGTDVDFSVKFRENICYEKTYNEHLEQLESCLECYPGEESLIKELSHLRSMSDQEKAKYPYWVGTQYVILEADMPFDVNIPHNAVIYHNQHEHRQVTCITETGMITIDHDESLEDVHEKTIKKFLLCLVMACTICAPNLWIDKISASFDGCGYYKERLMNSQLQRLLLSMDNDLLKGSYSLIQVFSWVKRNLGVANNNDVVSIPIACLSYMLNRDIHESFVYAIIGLENIYIPESKGNSQERPPSISISLQRRISALFPSVKQKDIKTLYGMRSRFVHGATPLAMCDDYMAIREKTPTIARSAAFAFALLIATIRKLIENDATRISFIEHVCIEYI